MSNVVAFTPDRKGRPLLGSPGETGAQILFFTGIRYMRIEDEDGAADDLTVAVTTAEPARSHAAREQAERLKA